MAISTYKSFLMKKATAGDTWEKLIDIKDFPNMGGPPEMLEATTMSDKMQVFIAGIQSLEALGFTANYTKDDYIKLKAFEGEEYEYALWFGGTETGRVLTPTGTEGKFEFSGYLSVYPMGGGVNEVVSMTITIAPSTAIEMAID